MKKAIIVMVLLASISLFVYAQITPQELLDAEETLRQMDSKISVLRRYVQIAYRGTSEGITLTAEQIQALKDAYSAEKAELASLYQQLP